MAVHLVSVEVGVVRVAVRIVHPDGLLGGGVEDSDVVGHYSGFVEGGLWRGGGGES